MQSLSVISWSDMSLLSVSLNVRFSSVDDVGYLTKPGTARLQAAVAVNSKSRYGLSMAVGNFDMGEANLSLTFLLFAT